MQDDQKRKRFEELAFLDQKAMSDDNLILANHIFEAFKLEFPEGSPEMNPGEDLENHFDPRILTLAEKVGLKLSTRDSYMGYFFNGKDLALKYNLQWISDFDLLHEIGHIFACEEAQKDLLEYGLGGAIANENNLYCEDVVDENEQFIQETLAQLFSVYFGMLCKLPFKGNFDDYANSWETYLAVKLTFDPQEKDWHDWAWKALIRFDSMKEQLQRLI